MNVREAWVCSTDLSAKAKLQNFYSRAVDLACSRSLPDRYCTYMEVQADLATMPEARITNGHMMNWILKIIGRIRVRARIEPSFGAYIGRSNTVLIIRIRPCFFK